MYMLNNTYSPKFPNIPTILICVWERPISFFKEGAYAEKSYKVPDQIRILNIIFKNKNIQVRIVPATSITLTPAARVVNLELYILYNRLLLLIPNIFSNTPTLVDQRKTGCFKKT